MSKNITAAVLAGILSLQGVNAVEAADAFSGLTTLSPISGQGAAIKGRQYLLNVKIENKQAVGYFLNEKSRCKLTLMVAEAFNEADAPNFTTVRFETDIEPHKSARFATAQGKSIEFACNAAAQTMSVKSVAKIASAK